MDCKHYKYTEHYNSVLRGKMPNPVMFLLYPVLGACNHRCYYCQIEGQKYQYKVLSTEVVIDLLNQAYELGCRSFEICGLDSEPMLHKGIKEIYEHAGKLGFRCSLLTNGSIMDEEMAEIIAKYFDYIRFSVDSFDEEVFNLIRKPRANYGVDVVKQNIKMVVDAVAKSDRKVKCTVGIKACIVPENRTIEHMNSFINDGIKLGVDSISFKKAIHSSIDHDSYNYMGLEYHINSMSEQHKEGAAMFPVDIYWKEADIEPLENQCVISPYHLFIDTEGDVALCCYHWNKDGHVFGNIHENRLSEIWGSEKHWRALKGTKIHECEKYECKAISINNFMHKKVVENEGHLDFFG